MITKKIANKTPNTPINTVVPQPGATFPYSEFKGRNRVPTTVVIPDSTEFCFVAVDFVAIEKILRFFLLSVISYQLGDPIKNKIFYSYYGQE